MTRIKLAAKYSRNPGRVKDKFPYNFALINSPLRVFDSDSL